MAIDATIIAVVGNRLDLVPRGSNPSGQLELTVINPDANLSDLEGKQIWGGESDIMLGDKKIATRHGYTKIEMVKGWNQ